MIFFNKIETAFNDKKPFVCYRKPNDSKVCLYIQKDDFINYIDHLDDSGFVFAPFDNTQKSILIPSSNSDIYESKNYKKEITVQIDEFEENKKDKLAHITLVSKGIEAIKKGKYQKIVLSRKEEVIVNNFNLIKSFKKLLSAYESAMVYIWYHPKIGLWLGATPETLIKINNQEFETMSLAGTQLFEKNIKWTPKEIEEQQFVTDYITNNLSTITTKLTKSNTQTIKAGKLAHLQTVIKGTHKNNVFEIINTLHPTPAVCGLPKNEAKNFILDNENYNRTFYTGYLGEININKKTNLFVNLRCMEINDSKAQIFVGGGITADSNAENEWKETVNKTSTMKKALL